MITIIEKEKKFSSSLRRMFSFQREVCILEILEFRFAVPPLFHVLEIQATSSYGIEHL